MKKVLINVSLFVSVFLISCSDDDTNTTLNEAQLEIVQESGLSVDLTWNQVADAVSYDLFANDEIVEADLTTVDYTWSAEDRENVEYPVVFQVVSKDSNGGTSISNEVMLDDPIIGAWVETFSADRLEDGSFGEFINAEDIGVCGAQGVDSYVFSSDGSFVFESYESDDDVTCFLITIMGLWQNVGNQTYSLSVIIDNEEEELGEILFVFEGNTFNIESSDASFIYERQ